VKEPGLYKLDVINLHYYFDPVVVEVLEESQVQAGKKQIRAFLYNIKTGKDVRLVYPLQLEPTFKMQYFEVNPFFLTSKPEP